MFSPWVFPLPPIKLSLKMSSNYWKLYFTSNDNRQLAHRHLCYWKVINIVAKYVKRK